MMSLLRTHCWLTPAALFLCALPCLGQATLKEVLSYLPENTETVTVANGPFPLPDFDKLAQGDWVRPELPSADLELHMRALPLGLLGLKNGGLSKALKNKAVAFAVEGSRHFRSPAALGETRYEGCAIVVFGPTFPFDRDSFIKDAAKSAVRFEEIARMRIAVFEEQMEDDVWTTFVGFPRSNIVLVATDADYLRTVLARIGGASGPRALPETLAEWKYVNTRAPLWGLRHYQRLEADSDPTSPFEGRHAANAPDEMAVGFAFWFEPAARRMATVTYLSTNPNARQIVQDYLSMTDAESASPREFQIRFRQPAPGVTQGTVALSPTEVIERLLFGLFAMLGHAIYV